MPKLRVPGPPKLKINKKRAWGRGYIIYKLQKCYHSSTFEMLQIEKRVIEANEEYFRSINLLFRWNPAATGILDHCVTLEGLVIGDDPCYVNLVIDRSSASSHAPLRFSRLSLETLISFRTSHSTINMIEEIGTKYMEFGICLLNDHSGRYISSLEKDCRAISGDIIRKILEDWIGGRRGAKPVEWSVLAKTLDDIGLQRLASDIRRTLNLI